MTWHICRLGNPYKLTFILPGLYPGWGSRSKRSIFARLREVKSFFCFNQRLTTLVILGSWNYWERQTYSFPTWFWRWFSFSKRWDMLVPWWAFESWAVYFFQPETLKSYKCIGRYLIYDFHTRGWIDSRNLQLTLPGTRPLKMSRSSDCAPQKPQKCSLELIAHFANCLLFCIHIIFNCQLFYVVFEIPLGWK